jgi:hypothetical protein
VKSSELDRKDLAMRRLSIALLLVLAGVAFAAAEDYRYAPDAPYGAPDFAKGGPEFPYGAPPAPGRGGVGPDPIQGNDTGGIIAWRPEIAHLYREIAAAHCARYNKVPDITSVHRRYGDYVGFRCYFPRGYDPRKWMLEGPPLRVLN